MSATLLALIFSTSVSAQVVTVVGTRHLSGLEISPTTEQLEHTVEALASFNPTQVCVERMSGERIELLLADPQRHGFSFKPDWHGRPLATKIVPIGAELQLMLERRAADARAEASALIDRWNALNSDDQIRVIALQLAGYEFHSATLNWFWLERAIRDQAVDSLGQNAVDALNEALSSSHEVYSLGVRLAHRVGLHDLCTADSQEDESTGIKTALALGGDEILAHPEIRAKMNQLVSEQDAYWQPGSGQAALTRMLEYFNSDEFIEQDQRLQWEALRKLDNEAGAFHRRFMYWHARTAEISAELYRALAQGPQERVMLIIGAAHRPFTEAELRSQPWIEVKAASSLLDSE